MSMFGGYSAALQAPSTSSPTANNRSTTATAHANSTAGLGTGEAGILFWCVLVVLIALAALVAARVGLRNVRIG